MNGREAHSMTQMRNARYLAHEAMAEAANLDASDKVRELIAANPRL